MIRSQMKNCIEEVFYKAIHWLDPYYATYGNKENTFSSSYEPIIYDYIFHKTHADRVDAIEVYTNWYEMPFFKTLIHLNDDEEVAAEAAAPEVAGPAEPAAGAPGVLEP